jgi:hypothetical protein
VVEDGDVQLLLYGQQAALAKKAWGKLAALLRLDDAQSRRWEADFKQGWRQYWLLGNILQFLPGFEAHTSELAAMREAAPEVEPEAVIISVDEVDVAAWSEAFELADPEVEGLLKEAMAAGTAVPEVGFELTDERGIVTGMAELAWVDEKTAVFLAGQEGDREAFEKAGWKAFDISDLGLRISDVVEGI